MLSSSTHMTTRAAGYALACLLALVFTGVPEVRADGKTGVKENGGESSFRRRHRSHHWPHGRFHRWVKGDEKHKRHKEAHGHIGRHRRLHGSRSRGWGNWGSSACGGGQGACATSSGSGYRGLASALGSAASQLTGQSRQLQQLQQEIVQESMNDSPGRDNPDARRFDESTQSGASRFSEFTDASDPIVQEQIAMYNDIGDTRDELDAEAEKYLEQEKDMNELASKSENNADNLVSKDNGVNGAQGSAGKGGKPTSTIANDSDGNILADGPEGKQAANSDISASSPEGDSSKNAEYPARLTNAEKASSALGGTGADSSASAKGDLRNKLRDRLRDASGSSRARNAGDYDQNEATAYSNGGQTTNSAAARNSEKSEKGERPTIDSASAEESISAFERDLGGGAIALAGSETDASVKAMLKEFGVGKENSREPASLQNSEIGSKEGPSLFERCRATHKRCAKNGCVTLVSGEKAGG